MTVSCSEAEIVKTPDQMDAIERAVDSVRRRKRLFRIGGYAGTGKTTIAKSIIAELSRKRCAACAFTGKAASVMRSKGLADAQTIHKTIYRFDTAENKFFLRDRVDADFFLLDEASMVNSYQWADMMSFNKPIIAIGDPGQLQPVGYDPRLMVNPDITLTQIHRQDADSAIIQFATHVRSGLRIRKGKKGEVTIGDVNLFRDSLQWADILLCGMNKTRVKANNDVRRLLFGSDAKHKLIQGDRIICLKNDNQLGVNNGEIFTVHAIKAVTPKSFLCDLVDCDGEMRHDMNVLKCAFGVPKPDKKWFSEHEVVIADYGYCTSVHKFQGSEADKVAVLSEQCDLWCPVRWSYTAITRAAKELRFSI